MTHYAFDASLARRGLGGLPGQRAEEKWDKLEIAKQVLGQGKLL